VVQPVTVQQRVAGLVHDSYGRLLALLAAPTRDIAAAEDALADSLERALTRWPTDGIPAHPEAWLLTVARNRMRDLWKSNAYRETDPLDETLDSSTEVDDMPAIPDRRLELMLVCAHPAIAPPIRTPLMLQTVLGVEATAIAEAFAIEPAAMAQRLVRAKKRIRDAGIGFALPERDDLTARLPAVLEAVYGAYAIDWLLMPQGAPIETLSAEALHLAMMLAELLPDEQDRQRWDGALIARGEDFLRRAHHQRRPGRFQYEAAIQSAHCVRPVDHWALRKLYRALLRIAPSLGAAVAAAAVDGEIDGPDAGLRALDAIDDPAAQRFQAAWSTRAHLLRRAGREREAAEAYRTAIELTNDYGVADYLREQLTSLSP
jgi:RNA polymerase sigma-70 factor, ECF subfamily